MNHNLVCSWSGGKDSCFALMRAISMGYKPAVLLNVLNEEGQLSRSHGIPKEILQSQAEAMNLPIHLIASSWNEYEQHFTNALLDLKNKYDLSHAVFGDIDLQAHRDWEEKVCYNAGISALLPLWKEDRKSLVQAMLEEGIEATIVSCNENMGENYLGRLITASLLEELDALGVDPCGENGEYHTLVTNAPLFTKNIKVEIGHKRKHDRYWFAELH
jgi:uncharacterized protein (TIGR00290 family)